jgi:hypothetical protein
MRESGGGMNRGKTGIEPKSAGMVCGICACVDKRGDEKDGARVESSYWGKRWQ